MKNYVRVIACPYYSFMAIYKASIIQLHLSLTYQYHFNLKVLSTLFAWVLVDLICSEKQSDMSISLQGVVASTFFIRPWLVDLRLKEQSETEITM